MAEVEMTMILTPYRRMFRKKRVNKPASTHINHTGKIKKNGMRTSCISSRGVANEFVNELDDRRGRIELDGRSLKASGLSASGGVAVDVVVLHGDGG